MKNVLLVDVDSKIPNLALMKISAYHKLLGDNVGFNIENPDTVYISCIFTKNAGQANGIATYYPNAKICIGGSGISLSKTLPEKVELLKPDYDLYPSEYSQGFTTRGCVRHCEFCIVPTKEGVIRKAQHPSEFHDDKFNTCMIMDNNLFGAKKEWVKSVFEWFCDGGVKMLSPQGWDARLLTEEYAGMLKNIKHPKGIRFAWDNIKDEAAVIKSISLLKNAGFNLKNDISFYVLVGFAIINGKPVKIPLQENDIYRCYKLRELGVNAFVMPYHKKDKRINDLARWANRRWLYWSIPFSEYKNNNHSCGGGDAR